MSTKVAYSLDFLTEAVLQSEFLRAITPPRQCYGSVGSVTASFRFFCHFGKGVFLYPPYIYIYGSFFYGYRENKEGLVSSAYAWKMSGRRQCSVGTALEAALAKSCLEKALGSVIAALEQRWK